ncbi:11291_t:CDS:2 [Ambispora gerdemannii]|uniref:11291_t:CDS:1 n=1 Tax=Ambispora gerdemannii TaxID=144530 RepID=A0A9N8WA73_9GLOM|nr:11291_t:CDS:2 [Ambispora gerdemannii]
MECMSKGDRLKLKYPDYWDRDPSAWRKLSDWDIYWIGNQPPSSSITKQNSYSTLANELRCLKEIYANTHPAYNIIKNLQKEMKESIIIEIYVEHRVCVVMETLGWPECPDKGCSLELNLWSECPSGEKKGMQRGLQIARRGFQLYSDMEFDSVERERKRLNIFKTSQNTSTGSFADLRKEGGYYLDKTYFVSKIEGLDVRAILSLRPRRFGKTLFLSTLSSYYDVKNKGDRFEQLFGDFYIGKNPTPLASSFLVLRLNFSGLRTNSTFEVFEEDFHKILNVDMTKFMCRYRHELKNYYQVLNKKESALVNFKELLNAVELSEHKFSSRTEAIKSSFKQFYSRLKSACDAGIAYVFQTGVTPIVVAEFTSGFNISEDLALNKKNWDIPDNIKEELITWLKNENDGYFFHPRQPERIFNTARVLYCIRKFLEQKEESDNSWNSLTTHDALLNFPSDPQTLPSQISLDLIVNNPLGKSILTEALSRHPLESKDGIAQRFRLINIRELATDRTQLLSFMFYIGAITYQPSLSTKHYFRIPDHLTEREFIREALKIYDWKDDLIPVRSFLQILEADNNIEPLCRFIENTLLKPLKGNSIVYSNEEALKQAFMDAMILNLHAGIEPEFQVPTEVDNIQMKKIILDGASGRWQDATKVSRSLLEKSEEIILGLKIDDEHRKTVAEDLEYKINTKKIS